MAGSNGAIADSPPPGATLITPNGAPLLPGWKVPIPPIAPLAITTKEQLQGEYVAGQGSATWYANYGRALEWAGDDLQGELGDDIYDKMLRDPQVAGCMQVYKASILEGGLHFTAAVQDRRDDPEGYELAQSLQEEAEVAFNHEMVTPLDAVLWNMLDAIPLGNKVAEIAWEYQAPYKMKNSHKVWQPRTLKVKPRQAYAIVVDGYLNVIGIMGKFINMPSPVMTGWWVNPDMPPPTLLPPDMFWLFSYRPADSDPRGTSLLRPAYDPWWLKRQVLAEYIRYLIQFAGPSLWATTPEKAQQQVPVDSTYTPTAAWTAATNAADPNGPALAANQMTAGHAPMPTPEEFLASRLAQVRNGAVGVFPFGTEIHQLLVNTGDGRAFTTAIDMFNQQITKCMLSVELATEQNEGAFGTGSASQVHQDAQDSIVQQSKGGFIGSFNQQIVKKWVRRNWGEAAVPYAPVATLGATQQHDQSDLMAKAATLYAAGWFDPSQLAPMDERMGNPARSPEEIKMRVEKAVHEAEMAKRAAEAPPPQIQGPGQAAGAQKPAPAQTVKADKQPVAPITRAVHSAFFAEAFLPPVPGQVTYPKKKKSFLARLWDKLAGSAYAGLLFAGLVNGRWSWDADTLTYSGRGKTLGPDEQVVLRNRLLDATWVDLPGITESLLTGETGVPVWEEEMQDAISNVYAIQYLLGRGGFKHMADEDWFALGEMVSGQYAYLRGFAQAILTGELSAAQIVARAKLYLSSAVQAFECGQAAALGVAVSLPAFPGDGSTACHCNCRCHWHLVPRPLGGVVDAWWITHQEDGRICDDCIERGKDWAPLTVFRVGAMPHRNAPRISDEEAA